MPWMPQLYLPHAALSRCTLLQCLPEVKKYTAIKSSSNTPEANHVTVNPSFVFVVPVPFARRNAEGGVRRNNVRTGLVPRAIELVPSSSTDHRR